MDPIPVLIVDDEGQFVDAVVERLRLRGFAAEGVTSGHDAMELLNKKPFDVVLLDMRMPGLSGLEVLSKAREKWPGMQVVLLTGHGSPEDVQEGMRLGAFEYMMKPVNIDALIGTIRAASEDGTKSDG